MCVQGNQRLSQGRKFGIERHWQCFVHTDQEREQAGALMMSFMLVAHAVCGMPSWWGEEAVPFSLSHPPISPLRTKYSDQSVPP